MTVQTLKNDHITTIVLDRREARNAVDRDTAQALSDAFVAFEQDEDSRVAVLYGAHGHFCAGADLKAFAAGRPNRLEPDGDGPMGPTRMMLSKPVIAAISGYAVAGGLELALWCDLRVAEEDATLGVFCRRFGVPLIDGGTVRLPRIIGMGHAMDLILTGRAVSAQEALGMGLINRVVPPGQALQAAEALARQISGHPQACMRSDRESAYRQWELPLAEALAMEFELGQRVLDEAAQGATRFAQGAGRHGSFEQG